MYDKKEIGEANYLKKRDGQYIPFKLKIEGINCA